MVLAPKAWGNDRVLKAVINLVPTKTGFSCFILLLWLAGPVRLYGNRSINKISLREQADGKPVSLQKMWI